MKQRSTTQIPRRCNQVIRRTQRAQIGTSSSTRPGERNGKVRERTRVFPRFSNVRQEAQHCGKPRKSPRSRMIFVLAIDPPRKRINSSGCPVASAVTPLTGGSSPTRAHYFCEPSCSAIRFGAALRQAALIALRKSATFAAFRQTLVQPCRPQAPFTGVKADGAA